MGSWAGNLAMKNRHEDFPSETYISMVISGSKIVTGNCRYILKSVPMTFRKYARNLLIMVYVGNSKRFWSSFKIVSLNTSVLFMLPKLE